VALPAYLGGKFKLHMDCHRHPFCSLAWVREKGETSTVCSGAKIAGAELADNCREKRQLDSREKKRGSLQLKRGEGLGMVKELSKSRCTQRY